MKQHLTKIKNALVLSFILFFLASQVNATATINVYFGDLPANAYYTIKTDGTNIWAVRYDGYKASESTSASTVINYALTHLTSGRIYGETIYCKGSFTIDAKLVVSSYTTILIDGKWTKGFSGTLLENANRATHDHAIIIRGIGEARIEGAEATYTGAGIDILCATGDAGLYVANVLELYNLRIKDFDLQACKIDLTGMAGTNNSVKIYECLFHSVNEDALWVDGIQDFTLIGGSLASFDTTGGHYGLYMHGCSNAIIHPQTIMCEHGDGANIVGNWMTDFSCGLVDGSFNAGIGGNLIRIQAEAYSNFHDITLRFNNAAGVANNTYDGIIQVAGGAGVVHNRFSNIWGGRMNFGTTHTMKYCIEEAADSNYNIYSNIDGSDCASGALRIQGANSKADTNSTIGTIVWA